MLPLKWKIFRVINFIHFSFCFILFAIVGWFAIRTGFQFPDSLFILLPFVSVCNCYLNLHILRRYFPDRLLTDKTRGFFIFLFVVSILAGIALMGLIYIGAESEFSSDNNGDPTGKILLGFLTLVLVLQAYILIVQFQIRDFLKTNNKDNIEKLIDSIGNTD